MKKYLFTLLIIIGALSACTNEDQIDIQYETTFKLMPSSVISGFKEYKEGEFRMQDGFKIRTSLFIYDKSGMLVDKQVSYLDSYSDVMNITAPLPLGEYIAVATTDVVKYSNSNVSLELWIFKDPEELSTFNIVDAGYIGYSNEILGTSSINFTVDKQSEITIPIKPAGSLITYRFYDIHKFDDIIMMGLYFSRTNDYLFFDENASPQTKIISKGKFDYRIAELDLTDSFYDPYDIIYGYNFKLPDPEFVCKFALLYTNGYIQYTDPMTIKMEAGQQYLATLDFEAMTYKIELTNGTTKSAASELVLPNVSKAVKKQIFQDQVKAATNQTLHVQDLVKKHK